MTRSSTHAHALSCQPTVMDVGVGILYFFTSHMVIQALYYVGAAHTFYELAVFFLIVVSAVIFAHVISRPLMKTRFVIESVLDIPIISVLAAVGTAVALISMMFAKSLIIFCVGGGLLGLACGWIVVVWTSTIRTDKPDSSSFFIHPSLLIAVGVYFLFRCVSTLSEFIAQGFLLALPLAGIACIIQHARKSKDDSTALFSNNGKSLQVLVVVSAIFALACNTAIYLSDFVFSYLSSGLNKMVILEVLAVALMLACCWTMNRFSQTETPLSPKLTAFVVFLMLYPLIFVFGLVMGGVGIPSNSALALWESNIWVLIVAIFAYDIRDTPYAIKGLSIGLMFEAMCIGQIISYIALSNYLPYPLYIALGLSAAYFLGVGLYPFRFAFSKGERNQHIAGALISDSQNYLIGSTESQTDPDQDERTIRLTAYCKKLALNFALTSRETEILELIAVGRSAKYISDEFIISSNTVRTHIRHIYEKLNIHSKQELIDLVHFGTDIVDT